MHHGALIPYRFNERVDLRANRKTYDAITNVFYIANRAYAFGLTDKLTRRHTVEFLTHLYSQGVTVLSYYSNDEFVEWGLYEKNGKVKGTN